jgi:hypothetical protein
MPRPLVSSSHPLLFTLFREDIVFRDRINTFRGIDNYKLIFWALRFHGKIFFKAIWVDIHRIWQPNDKVIMVRWTVRGVPQVPWEAQGHFDGTSEYKLDKVRTEEVCLRIVIVGQSFCRQDRVTSIDDDIAA